MAGRSEFGIGILLGGLIGAAIGYFLRRTTEQSDDGLSAPETIDLTPALRRRETLDRQAGEAASGRE